MAYKIIIKELDTPTVQRFCLEQKESKGEMLLSVSLQRAMYKPGCLEVSIFSQTKKVDDFKGKLITLADMHNGNKIYANDYFIVNVRKKGTDFTLKAYSADYFLTIDKFCQAFTAKTLVNGIINPTLRKYNSRNFQNFRLIANSETNNDVKNYAWKHVVNFLDSEEETIIPYAVQYNESFYDFLVRMCNRDGEFLYMDNENNLRIGLKSTQSNNIKFSTNEVEYIDSYEESDESNWLDKNYLSGNSASYSKNGEGSAVYSYNGVYAPEFFEKIEKDEFTNRDDYTNLFNDVSTAVRNVLLNKTISDAIISTGISTLLTEGSNLYTIKEENEKFKEKFPKGTLYSSNIKTRDSKGYKDLYEYQSRAEAGQARIEKSAMPNVSLGDIVEIKEDSKVKFVVYNLNITSLYKKNIGYRHDFDILLVKDVDSHFYPLPMPEKRVRKSTAQRAVVIDNYDPERLGRVRILYPWQNVLSDDKYWEEIKKEINFVYNIENINKQNLTEEQKKEIEEKKKEIDKDNIEKFHLNNIQNRKNATPWIRVSYPMASDGSGFMFTPAKGDEVLIDYEDGNIEKPYICGAFYNHKNMPSAAAQTNDPGKVKSISSANGHHISFTDGGGAHKLVANMFPLMKTLGSFGLGWGKFDSEENKYYGGGFEIADRYGIYSIKGSTHGRSINVSSPFGNIKLDAFSGITINAPSGDVKIVGKNVTIEARNNLKIESGTNIKNCLGSYFKDDAFQYKGMFADFAEGLVESTVGGLASHIDLSLIRHILEVFLRPVGGTLLIKSNRYLHLEAGKGKTSTYYHTKDKANNKLVAFLNKTSLSPLQQAKEEAVRAKSALDSWADRLKADVQLLPARLAFINADNSIISKRDIEQQYMNDPNKDQMLLLRNKCESYLKEYKKLIKMSKIDCFNSQVDDSWSTFKNAFTNANAVHDLQAPMPLTLKQLVFEQLKAMVATKSEYKYLDLRDAKYDNNENELKENIKISDNAADEEKNRYKEAFYKGLKKTFDYSGYSQSFDDKIWSKHDTGAILISDSKDSFYKMNDEGQLVKGWSIDYKKEFIDIMLSL